MYLVIDHSRESGPAVVNFESEATVDSYISDFKSRRDGGTMGWTFRKVDSLDGLTDFERKCITTWKPE